MMILDIDCRIVAASDCVASVSYGRKTHFLTLVIVYFVKPSLILTAFFVRI